VLPYRVISGVDPVSSGRFVSPTVSRAHITSSTSSGRVLMARQSFIPSAMCPSQTSLPRPAFPERLRGCPLRSGLAAPGEESGGSRS